MRAVHLGDIDQIALGEGRIFRVGFEDIAVFRTRDGKVFATQAQCPHEAGPLADGLLGQGCVACPLHGWKFDLASGQGLGQCSGRLRTYPVQLDASGQLLLYC